jgi:hypothetical protein
MGKPMRASCHQDDATGPRTFASLTSGISLPRQLWMDGEGDLKGQMVLDFFCAHFCKILILRNLLDRARAVSAQNLEPQGLTAKIFWNKE